MKKIRFILALLLSNFALAQELPPLPPKPREGNIGIKKEINSLRMYAEPTEKVLPKFSILLSPVMVILHFGMRLLSDILNLVIGNRN